MASRALFGATVAFLLVVVLSAVVTATAAADYHYFGEQQFSAAASEKWGVRGWYRTVSPYVGNVGQNFSLSRVCVAAEVTWNQPYVECGYYKGRGRLNVTKPTWFWGYNPSGDTADFWEAAARDWQTLSFGSLHKYGVSRTAHYSNGDTQWTIYFDGESYTQIRTPRPDQGHPQAGGEVNSLDTSCPAHMNTQGRNNGTGSDG